MWGYVFFNCSIHSNGVTDKFQGNVGGLQSRFWLGPHIVLPVVCFCYVSLCEMVCTQVPNSAGKMALVFGHVPLVFTVHIFEKHVGKLVYFVSSFGHPLFCLWKKRKKLYCIWTTLWDCVFVQISNQCSGLWSFYTFGRSIPKTLLEDHVFYFWSIRIDTVRGICRPIILWKLGRYVLGIFSNQYLRRKSL